MVILGRSKEVCNTTHHVYGIVAHAVSITVISDASPLQHNDIVRAWWRDQPIKHPSPTGSSSYALASNNP
jgi:hypothetical protein